MWYVFILVISYRSSLKNIRFCRHCDSYKHLRALVVMISWEIYLIFSLLFVFFTKNSAAYVYGYGVTENTLRMSTCDCPKQIYGEEYDYAEIKKPVMNFCEYQHCVFQIDPGRNTSIALTLESISLSASDIVRIYQYITVNDTEIELLHCAEVRKVKTCPYPVLVASSTFKRIPAFDRPGQISCPFRILPSTPGHRILITFNSLKSVVFDQKGEEEKFFKRISSAGATLVSATSSIDFLLTKTNVYQPTSFNINYKELLVDPCYCNDTEVIVGGTPIYVTSPGFPDLYCSNFHCKTKFVHNATLHDDTSLTFVIIVHFLNTDKHDYVDFFTDGFLMERLNGTHKDVEISMSGDVMETKFVTDQSISRHGYNMSVKSVRIPTDCTCPHKGVKVMRTSGSLQMDVPGHCTILYCKWVIPPYHDQVQFTTLFNFSSEFDSLTMTTGSDVRRFSTITGKHLKRHWRRSERTEGTTVLYQRAFPANYSLDSKVASFSVKWMDAKSPDCFCDNEQPEIHEATVGDWRELTSPAYPLPYCGDMECTYKVIAPAGHHIVLNITDFYTEPYNDVLALFDGVNTTGRHMDVFHGKKWFPYLIRNKNEILSLTFKTDHDVSYDGFRILFTAEPNEYFDAPLKSQTHTSTIIIFILSIMLIVAIGLAVYRRAPRMFDNPVYAGSVSYSEETINTNTNSGLFR